MEINFYFKPTPKGFRAKSTFIELSIHKGMNAWGRTTDSAVNNLVKKWNKQVKEDERRLNEEVKEKEGITIRPTYLTFYKKEENV